MVKKRGLKVKKVALKAIGKISYEFFEELIKKFIDK